MKRTFSTAAMLLLCIGLLFSTASALDDGQIERIDYEDGSYAIISTVCASRTRSQFDSSKDYTYYNSDDQRCFSYTLYASFTYDGVTSSADSCYCDAVIYHRGWTGDSHSEWTSGNTAYGRAVFSGPNGLSIPVNLTLTCDKDGNVK